MRDATDITILIDRSGSMESIRDDTIGGFNTFIEDQKKVPGDACVTLVQFDADRKDWYKLVYEATPLAFVKPLDRETFVPRGGTALLDAMGRAIDRTGTRLAAMPEHERPDKVIFVVVTDGEENSSKKFNRQQVFDRVTRQQSEYKWQFVFLAANQDAIATGANYGFMRGSSLSFAGNQVGTQALYASASGSVSSYRTGKSKDVSFSDEDRETQAKAGAKAP